MNFNPLEITSNSGIQIVLQHKDTAFAINAPESNAEKAFEFGGKMLETIKGVTPSRMATFDVASSKCELSLDGAGGDSLFEKSIEKFGSTLEKGGTQLASMVESLTEAINPKENTGPPSGDGSVTPQTQSDPIPK